LIRASVPTTIPVKAYKHEIIRDRGYAYVTGATTWDKAKVMMEDALKVSKIITIGKYYFILQVGGRAVNISFITNTVHHQSGITGNLIKQPTLMDYSKN